MLIQPIKILYEKNGNRVSASKLRKEKIKTNIENIDNMNALFLRIRKNLEKGHLDNLHNLLENELFFEEIHHCLIIQMYKAFLCTKDREIFIEELRESYIIRGVKSVVFAWSPIISKEIVS